MMDELDEALQHLATLLPRGSVADAMALERLLVGIDRLRAELEQLRTSHRAVVDGMAREVERLRAIEARLQVARDAPGDGPCGRSSRALALFILTGGT